jgi:3',5'-cyclic-nucleotide phosphodiesterase
MEIFMTLLSGAAHDMDHPGTNNVFEIKCKSKLSILYND